MFNTVQLILCPLHFSVKINQETMTIVEDEAIDEDEVTVSIQLKDTPIKG